MSTQTSQSLKQANIISFTDWKESVNNCSNLSDFNREIISTALKKINKEKFNKLKNTDQLLSTNSNDFIIFSYLEGEITTMTLNYFKFNMKNYNRLTLKLEYGKLIYMKPIKNININFSDFEINNKNELKLPGFVILTKFVDNELISKLYDFTVPIDKYLSNNKIN
jgi:hypothetical protein